MSLNAFADGYNKGYQAGYDDATEDRAALEARVRALEAEVIEARAAERCAVAAWLRADANRVMGTLDPDDRSGYARVYSALHLRADAIADGEHRAGGAR